MSEWQYRLKDIMCSEMAISSSMGTRKWVDVTHIKNPNNFYIRPCIYSQFLPVLQVDTGKKAIDLSKQSAILFKSLQHGWVRGYILKKNNNPESYVIFAMDYGFTEKSVQASNIHEICCSYVRRVPPLAMWCSLNQCEPKGRTWSDQAIKMFKKHVEMLPCHVIIYETSCSSIQYVEFVLPTQIGNVLVLFEVAVAVSGSKLYEVVGKTFTKHLYYRHPRVLMSQCYNVILTHIANESTFFVSILEDYEKFCKRKASFYQFANTLPVLEFYRLKNNLPVCYVTNNEAKHATVQSIDRTTKKATLTIMDDGSTIEIEESTLGKEVRALDEIYLKTVRAKVLTLYCKSVPDIVVTLTPGCKYKIRIYELGDRFLTPHKTAIIKLT